MGDHADSFRKFLPRLQELICDSFTGEEFERLLGTNLDPQDHAAIPASQSYGGRVFEALQWAYRVGGCSQVIWLAKLAGAERPQRPEWDKLIKEMEKACRAGPADSAKYLRCLHNDTAYIDIRGLQVGSGKAHCFPIDELYIPLTTAGGGEGRREKGEGKAKGKGQKEAPSAGHGLEREMRVDLDQALQHRCLVIIGDPGAGKTTFLRRIAHRFCRARLEGSSPVPSPLAGRVRVGTEEHRERSPLSPPASGGTCSPSSPLGLSETPFPIFIRLEKLVTHMAASRAQNAGPTLVDSPRWIDHFLANASDDSCAGLDEAFFHDQLESGQALVLLDGLDEAPTELQRRQLTHLVQNAGQAYEDTRFVVTSRPAAYQGETVLPDPDFAHVRIDALDDPAIETFLTHWCKALFPESAARAQAHLSELRDALSGKPEIRRLARNPVMLTALAVVHWNQNQLPEQRAELYESVITWLAKSRKDKPNRTPVNRCKELHGKLALAMQDHPRGRKTQVSRRWAAEQIEGKWRNAPEDERAGLAEAFLEEEELDSGIIVRRGHDVSFWHLTFQEYLAARALAGRAEDSRRGKLFTDPKRFYSPEWREVVLLLAGVLCQEQEGYEEVDGMFSAILDQLGDGASLADRARCFGLLGAAVQDLAPFKYQPGDPRYARLKDKVMAIFDPERSASVPIETAIEAAEALGQAGDPRFGPRDIGNHWVEIPAGEFWMGAQKKDRKGRNYDAEADHDESPVHKIQLAAYRIGKYPVTVAEYQRFVDDGGYAKEEYWKAGGFGQWETPDEWDEQLAHPNRPVMNVSWYEAAAYAAWAKCRLPTEAEWERAARGTDGRRYPWGDEDISPSLANYDGSKIGHPTPVGVYPLGGTPEGIMDLAGNVWEWCADVWHDNYEGATTDGSAWTTGGNQSARVLRGGSWDGLPGGCRAALRDGNSPGVRWRNSGFRVVGLGGGAAGTP